jgi:membrane protein
VSGAGRPRSDAGTDESVGSRDGSPGHGRGSHAETPAEIPPRGYKEVFSRVRDEIQEDQVSVVAAGLAFYAMLSVFPALIAAVSIYGLFADPADVQRQLESLGSALPESAADVISTQLSGIVANSGAALSWTAALAVGGALWSASSGAQQLIAAVGVAYDEEDDRGFFRRRGLALLFTLGFLLLGLLSLALIVVIPPLLERAGLASGWEWSISVGRFLLLALVVVVTLSAIYRFAPDRDDPEWRWVSWGAAIATIIWVGASVLFSVYVSSFGNFNETYGSLAGVIVLLLWFYLSAFIILLGAEINAELEHQTVADTTTGPDRPMGTRGAVKADTTPSAPSET